MFSFGKIFQESSVVELFMQLVFLWELYAVGFGNIQEEASRGLLKFKKII